MAGFARGLVLALAALSLAACATSKVAPRVPAPEPADAGRPETPQPPEPERPSTPRRFSPAHLPGWTSEDHAAAFSAYAAGCRVSKATVHAEICARARKVGTLTPEAARQFFETGFVAERLESEGVLTAYFAPVYEARRTPDAEFSAPVRPRPADLIVVDAGRLDPAQTGRPAAWRSLPGGGQEPYPDRAAIESGPAPDALAWMRPEELFFLQIQGSGVLVFEDGTSRKALYAANNGHAFVGVANPMRERGLLGANETSGDTIRAWLAAHRGPEAEAIMRLNPRYAFFSLAADDGRPPAGAAGIPLPSGRAIAVDTQHHSLGEVYWIEADAPILTGAFPSYRRLAVALDTGGAIKGDVRADLFLGQGAAAGAEAGRVRHRLRLYRLVPR